MFPTPMIPNLIFSIVMDPLFFPCFSRGRNATFRIQKNCAYSLLKLAKNMRKLAFWNLSVFLSILSGRSAEMVFEAAAEIKGIGKAAAFGHLCDGDVCFQQQIPRIFQPQPENILLGRCSGHPTEGLQEQRLFYAGAGSKLFQRKRTGRILMDMLQHFLIRISSAGAFSPCSAESISHKICSSRTFCRH